MTIPDEWHDFVLVGGVLVVLALVIGGPTLRGIRDGLLFVGFIMAVWFVAIWL